MESSSGHEHVVEIPRNVEPSHNSRRASPSSSSSQLPTLSDTARHRRNETRRRRTPLNSGLWISIEVIIYAIQIIASVAVLAFSTSEKPHAPLRAWVFGYAFGCFVTLPLLYWRYYHRSNVSDQEANQPSPHINVPAGPFSVSISRTSEGDDGRIAQNVQRNAVNSRVSAMVEYIKMGLDCYFAIWFVVGNVWIFGGHGSSSDAPNLYRLCIVFLAFSCIGYAMPFILCATFCCCLPCIVSVLGLREDMTSTRGATSDAINSLPTYKFKRNRASEKEEDAGGADGGLLAAGTAKERSVSGEDAICSICLAKYEHNEDVKELPCAHFFHKECVEKWLKINATCPLCKHEVGH